MKNKKVILLGGLILVLALGIYVVVWADDPSTSLDVGNNLNMKPLSVNNRIFNLGYPVELRDAATWGYVKDAVGGVSADSTIGIWRQSADPYNVYLNSWMGTHTLSGNVGIGTNVPQASLHVQGSTWVNNNLLVGGFIGVTACGAPGTTGIRIGDDSYLSDDDCSNGYYNNVPVQDTLYITSGDSIAIKSGNDGITGTNYGIHIERDGDVGIGTDSPGSYKLNVASADGHNSVLIGDDLTVGSLITTNTLNVDDDATILGSLTVSETIKVSGSGAEVCDSANEGTMRYFESVDHVAYFQVCMQTNSLHHGWYTIKSYNIEDIVT